MGGMVGVMVGVLVSVGVAVSDGVNVGDGDGVFVPCPNVFWVKSSAINSASSGFRIVHPPPEEPKSNGNANNTKL